VTGSSPAYKIVMGPRENKEKRLPETVRGPLQRLLGEEGEEVLQDIDDWDEASLDRLRNALGEEQFQAMLDELAEGGAHDR
jgi:hypothetical protein